MRKITVVLSILYCTAALAQLDMDSLWRVWSDERNNDTVRLKALSDFAWHGFLFSAPDSAIHFGQLMYDHAARKGMKREMAYALRGQGVAYKVRDENVKALDLFLRSMALSGEVDDLPGVAGSLNNIGILYFEQGDYPKALEYHQRSYEMRVRSGDLKGLGASLNSIGKIHEKRGDPRRALLLYMRALNSSEHLRFDLGAAYTLINIGGIYRGRGDRVRALSFYRAGLELHRKDKDNLSEAMDRNLIGATHLEGGDPMSAVVECGKALGLTKELNNLEEQRNACDCLYEAYRTLGDRDRALEYLERAKMIRDSLQDEHVAMRLQRMEFTFELRMDSIAAAEEEVHSGLLNQAAIAREKNRKNVFLAIGIGILLVSIGLYSRLQFISKAKQEAEVLQERAEAGERAKQQFLANMSHEIRTPMNAIMGMTDLLLRNEHDPGQDKYLDAIKLSSENLLVIINDILDLSKIDAGRVVLEQLPFEPRKVLAGVVAILEHKAEVRSLSLSVEVGPSVPSVLVGDPARLHQVLMNLLGNAIKFTEEGMVIVRAIANVSAKGMCELQVSVIDTGIGIAPDKLEKVFAEFDQANADTTRKYGGTGLGLTICKRLVELQGGTIEVTSTLGKGSVFTVQVPYAVEAEVESAVHEGVRKDLSDLRILLVEEDALRSIEAQDLMEAELPHVSVELAKDGQEAVKILQQEDFHVVFMDVTSPTVNGVEAAMAIRKLSHGMADVPIIAMVDGIGPDTTSGREEAGIKHQVLRPLERKTLLQVLSVVLLSRG